MNPPVDRGHADYEAQGRVDFWRVYLEHHAAVEAASVEVARADPRFGPIVAAVPEEEMARQSAEGLERLRRAFEANEWDAYEAHLRTQGEAYAAIGVDFAAWHRLIRVAERELTMKLVAQHAGDPARLTRALDAMQAFFARAVTVLHDAFLTRSLAERERIESALRISDMRFRRLAESGLLGVMVCDLHGNISEANETFLEIVGHTRAELEAGEVRWGEMTPPEWEAADLAAIEELEAHGIASPFEKEYFRGDGGRVPVLLCVAMLEAPECICLVLDITQRRQLESVRERARKLELENRRVQEASQLKSEFLANMSHELRTPLNAIIGFAELLHDGAVPPEAPEHREFLGDILTSGRHLLALINDVLDLSKVEAGKLELFPERVALEPLIGEVVSILRTTAANRGVRVQIDVDPALESVELDPSRAKQVLYNYLSNALKFGREDGRVTVRAHAETEDVFRLEVEDDGMGISAADRGRLFVEFQQLDGGASKHHEGTGLGLALTRRLVEAMGGSVGVDSEPGEGSTFFAVLPRRAAKGHALPEPRIFEPAPGAPRILVVEDDARDQTRIAGALTEAGYGVETVSTAAQALARCRETDFAAITLDLLLPDRTGLEVLQAIRAGGRNRDVPVIVITVVTEHGVIGGFAVQDVLPKPVDAGRLVEALDRAGVSTGSGEVWVVDDDAAALAQMTRSLDELGYPHRALDDARHALEALSSTRPAAIVLDLVMPELDGFAFLEQLRMRPEHRRLPVLVWTAKDLSADERARLTEAAQGIVPKTGDLGRGVVEALSSLVPPPPAAPPSAAPPSAAPPSASTKESP